MIRFLYFHLGKDTVSRRIDESRRHRTRSYILEASRFLSSPKFNCTPVSILRLFFKSKRFHPVSFPSPPPHRSLQTVLQTAAEASDCSFTALRLQLQIHRNTLSLTAGIPLNTTHPPSLPFPHAQHEDHLPNIPLHNPIPLLPPRQNPTLNPLPPAPRRPQPNSNKNPPATTLSCTDQPGNIRDGVQRRKGDEVELGAQTEGKED